MKFIALLLASLLSFVSISMGAEATMATITTDTGTGTVQYQVPGGTYQNLAWKDTVKVPVGTLIKTDKSGIVQVEVFPGGKVLVLPNSSFTVGALSVDTQGDQVTKRSGQIDLAEGTLKALLSHKGGNTSPIDFSVKTPTSVAAAKGTKYVVSSVTVNGVSTTYVLVIEGTVAVSSSTPGGSPTYVTAGQVVAIGAKGSVAVVALGDLPATVQAALNQAITTSLTTVNGTPTINASDASGSAHAGP